MTVTVEILRRAMLTPTSASGSVRVPMFFGRELAAMSSRERRLWIDRAFLYWRSRGFPFPSVSPTVARQEIDRLGCVSARDLHRTLQYPSTVGLRLANSFHPQMWSARVRGRSPIEVFENDELLRRCLAKAIGFWPDRRCWNERSVRIVVSIQNRARVANFRPTVARALMATLMPGGGSLLDFCAGYGGRLLAAASLKTRYVGIDAARAQCVGLRRMNAFLNAGAEIVHGCAEEVLPGFERGRFDVVFSSPPYFRLERYSDERSQSFRRYPEYRKWITGFLEPVIQQSFTVLRRGGYLALNVSNTQHYEIAEDAHQVARRIFGRYCRVYTMNMSTNPADKARSGRFVRTEPIFVYRK